MKPATYALLCLAAAATLRAQDAAPPPAALDWDIGADFRLRQEASDNLPKRGGTTAPNANYLRMRPRVWGQLSNDDFKLHLRLTDEFREYFNPRRSKNYQTPDEILVDNLYLDLYGLFGDRLDLRIGRQDFLGPQGPVYGAGRVLCDGTPADGSRTAFFDAIRATLRFDDKNSLDILAIYNNDDTELSWGHPNPYPDERPLTAINPSSTGLDEWGGALYFKSAQFDHAPFELYYIFKRETKARLASGARLPGRSFHTFGARLTPRLTETLTAELEGAAQTGEKDGGASTSGYMGYASLTYRPPVRGTLKPFFTGACYYLSGDKHRDGHGDNDRAWNPVWARHPQVSELYSYSGMYGTGYWSNLLYPRLEAGLDIAPRHRLRASVGPMYAAQDDGLGGGDGSLYGWLGVIRYDFPLIKNLFGQRGDLFGHVTAEILDPGDYYPSDTVAYFLRWELNARF